MKARRKSQIISSLKILAEEILPLFFWVFLILGFDIPYIAILTIAAAAIHECGHIAAINILCDSTQLPQAHISGFRIKKQQIRSYRDEIIILAMGPLFNIGTFLICLSVKDIGGIYMSSFGTINIATAISNLLPVEGYDGHGILTQVFLKKNFSLGIKLLEHVSFLFSVCLTFLSLYMIENFGQGYWIFGVFFILMMSKLIKYGKHDILGE